MEERNAKASIYIENCKRRRVREGRQFARKVKSVLRILTPFCIGFCIGGIAMFYTILPAIR